MPCCMKEIDMLQKKYQPEEEIKMWKNEENMEKWRKEKILLNGC